MSREDIKRLLNYPQQPELMERMLERISNELSKRESEIIFDGLAPASFEFNAVYLELLHVMQETFADTASREFLILRAKERGLEPYPATKAVLQAESTPTDFQLPLGARFSLETLNYAVIEKITNGQYQIECELAGRLGNKNTGDLIPIDYIRGLQTAKVVGVLIPGEDEEETEHFRKRYFDSLKTEPFGGNVTDYELKIEAIEGVGSVKISPVWQGGGTVRATLIDAEYNKATNVLIDKVQQIIDPTRDGMGVGWAPIGHVVTVDTVEEVIINITTSIVFEGGFSFKDIEESIISEMDAYMLELRKEWNKQDVIVRISQIETRILSLNGVVDITGTVINGVEANLPLESLQTPVLGVITSG